MLYDPKWEQQTKADPWSLNGLIAWLETMPPKTRYYFSDARTCLIAQYMRSQGQKKIAFYCHEIPEPFGEIANPVDGNETFGAALERARALNK